MSGSRDVLIIGGGIGGMAAAIALTKRGANVQIVEIDTDWKVYGAGLTMTAPTLRAFRDLGLLPAIESRGYFATGSDIYLFNGTPIAKSITPSIEPGLPASGGIMRPHLHEIMRGEIQQLGVAVSLGLTVDTFEHELGKVRVRFSDGKAAEFDLAIGADGIYSATRGKLFNDAVAPVYCGQMSWRVVAPRPPEMDVASFFFGHRNIAGIIPCSQTQVYSFVLAPEEVPTRVPEAKKVEAVRSLLHDFGGPMADIREGLGPDSSIVQRPFEYAFQPSPWNAGRVLLIGDAAHATTPHLASGAGMAVEDALVIAQELESARWDVPAAIGSFTERRYGRCKFIVDASTAIAKRELENAPPQEIGARMGEAMHRLAEAI